MIPNSASSIPRFVHVHDRRKAAPFNRRRHSLQSAVLGAGGKRLALEAQKYGSGWSGALLARRPVHRQQRRQVGQVHVAVTIEVAVLVGCTTRHSIVGK